MHKVRLQKNQIIILTAGVITMLLMGLLYVWSLFVAPLEEAFGWNRAETTLTFTISLVCFSFGLMASGWFGKKKRLRMANFIGICMVATGFAVVSQTGSLMMFYLFYGVLAGFGIGLSYNAWLSIVLSHFPGKTGMASGWLLLGFGVGGVALGPLVNLMINSHFGWRNTFLAIGIFIFAEGIAAMRFLHPRKESEKENAELAKIDAAAKTTSIELTTSKVIKEPSYWIFCAWKTILFCTGVAVVGQAALIMQDMGATVFAAAVAVALISAGNSIGRVATGVFLDRFGYKLTMCIQTLMFFACGVIYLFVYPSGLIAPVNTAMFMLGVSYGGSVIMTASFISTTYGQENFSSNFGLSNITNVPAIMFLSTSIGVIRADTGFYTGFFVMMAALGIISWFLMVFTDKFVKKMRKRLSDI